jgi:hypothetical protein
LEILGSHGADAARWPADERAALLALVADDAAVAAAMDAERRMDVMLGDWARDVPERQFEAEALLPAARVLTGRAGFVRWLAGGAVAAGLALALVGVRAPETVVVASGADFEMSSPGSAGDAAMLDDSFALFFTPTADEEDVI